MVDDSGLLWNQIPIKDKRLIDVVLCLQMASEGFSREVDATHFTIKPLMLLHGCCVPRLLCGILLLHLGYSHFFRQTHHEFCLRRACLEANAF